MLNYNSITKETYVKNFKFKDMININNYGVEKLSLIEIKSILGGGFFRDLGRFVGECWCAIKNAKPRKKPPGMTWNEFNGKF